MLIRRPSRWTEDGLPGERHTRSRAELGLGPAVVEQFHCIVEA